MLFFLEKRTAPLLEASARSFAAAAWLPMSQSSVPSGAVTARAQYVVSISAGKAPLAWTASLIGRTPVVFPYIHGYSGTACSRLTFRALSSCFGQQLEKFPVSQTSLYTGGYCFPSRPHADCQPLNGMTFLPSIYFYPTLFDAEHGGQHKKERWWQHSSPTPLTAAAVAAAAVTAFTFQRRSEPQVEEPTHTRTTDICPRRYIIKCVSEGAASGEHLSLQGDTIATADATPVCRRLPLSTASSCPQFCSRETLMQVTQQRRHAQRGGLVAETMKLGKFQTAPARCAASREGREVLLGNVSDFERGSLYELKIDESGKEKVLLAHLGSGEFYCVGATCTHFAAPLVKGILTSEDKVVCPWHDAEFDIKTGKCINGPSLDGLPSFPVSLRQGQVFVSLPNESLPLKQSPFYTQRVSGGGADQTFVIVGGGAAAAGAVETLRIEGFSGRIILLTKENTPPYDRTILSKNLLAKPENLLLRPQEYLERELGVELWLGAQVDNVDFTKKTLSVRMLGPRSKASDGGLKTLPFDKLLLCTGVAARSLSHLPNGNAKGIFTLRSLEDHQKLQQALEDMCKYNSQPRVVIIGSSFIGVESASAFKRRGFQHITLVSKENVPLERVVGRRVGEGIRQLIASKGVKFLPNTGVKGFTASGGCVTGVELDNGDVLQADVVLVGIGGDPCTQPFRDIVVSGSNAATTGVPVDPLLRVVGLSDVFAAGDIASYPYVKTGDTIRVEHWNVAMQQGRIAAANMLGQYKPFTQIPFFWSAVFGKAIRFAGFTDSTADEVIVEGDLEKQQFVAYYVKNDRVIAVCTMNRDPVAIAAVDLLSRNMMPSPGELRQGFKNSADLLALVHVNVLC